MTTNTTKIKQLEEFIKILQDDEESLKALSDHYAKLRFGMALDIFKLILTQIETELEVQNLKIVELCLTGK